jgi:hypothetical protein
MQPSTHLSKKTCIDVICQLCLGNYDLTKTEYKKLNQLRSDCITLFDPNNYDHEKLLKEVLENSGGTSWKSIGFQQENPRTDFRAGGFYSLKFIHYFSLFHHNVRVRLTVGIYRNDKIGLFFICYNMHKANCKVYIILVSV